MGCGRDCGDCDVQQQYDGVTRQFFHLSHAMSQKHIKTCA